MLRFVNCKAREIGEKILGGNTEVNPFEQKTTMPAFTVSIEMCAALTKKFRDTATGGWFANKTEEIWEKMKGEVQASWGASWTRAAKGH